MNLVPDEVQRRNLLKLAADKMFTDRIITVKGWERGGGWWRRGGWVEQVREGGEGFLTGNNKQQLTRKRGVNIKTLIG